MVTRASSFLALVFSVALMFGSMSASAQGQTTDLATVKGLQGAWSRTYAAPASATTATPDPNSPVLPTQMASTTVIAFAFNDEASATAFAKTQTDAATKTVTDLGTLATSAPAAEFGEGAMLVTTDLSGDGYTMHGVTYLWRAGTVVWQVSSLDPSADAAATRSKDIATFVFGKPASTAAVNVSANGTSTGGVFDAMPGQADATVLHGFVPMLDADLKAGAAS